MVDSIDYSFHQISDLAFKYDLALYDDDIIGDWVEEQFEAEEYMFYDTRFGTHAYTVYVEFYEIEDAVAFKLRWTN